MARRCSRVAGVTCPASGSCPSSSASSIATASSPGCCTGPRAVARGGSARGLRHVVERLLLPPSLVDDPATSTPPLGVQQFSSQYSVDTARVLAFTALSMLPALAFFSVFQRRIVGGPTGAVKG